MTKASANNVLTPQAPLELARSSVESAAHLLDKVIFSALLALIALTAIPYGAAHPWWEAVFECAVFALAALWVIEGLLGGAWRISGQRLLAPLYVLIAFAFMQTLPLWEANSTQASKITVRSAVSADPYETWLFVLKMLALVLSAALLMRYTSSRRRLRALVNLVVGVGVISALFSILRLAAQVDPWKLVVHVPLARTWGAVMMYLGPEQGYGQFLNRNHFAFLMEMGLGLTLGLVVGRGVRRNRLLIYLAGAALMWTALVLTTSRGAIFSMLGQLIFIILLFSVGRPLRKVSQHGRSSWLQRRGISGSLIMRAALIACLVTGGAASALWLGGDPLVSRLESLPRQLSAEGNDAGRGTRRIEIWDGTWQLIKANPIAGVGFGAYRTAITEHYDASGRWTPAQAHNDYLELLAAGGLIGAVIGIWFAVAFLRAARKRLHSADSFRRAACYGALIGIFGVAVHSLFDFGLHITINALIFMALVVVAVIDGRVEKKSLPSDDMRLHGV